MPLIWPVVFLGVGLITAIFGYGGIAAASAGIAQPLCILFAVLGLVTLLMHLARYRPNMPRHPGRHIQEHR